MVSTVLMGLVDVPVVVVVLVDVLVVVVSVVVVVVDELVLPVVVSVGLEVLVLLRFDAASVTSTAVAMASLWGPTKFPKALVKASVDPHPAKKPTARIVRTILLVRRDHHRGRCGIAPSKIGLALAEKASLKRLDRFMLRSRTSREPQGTRALKRQRERHRIKGYKGLGRHDWADCASHEIKNGTHIRQAVCPDRAVATWWHLIPMNGSFRPTNGSSKSLTRNRNHQKPRAPE